MITIVVGMIFVTVIMCDGDVDDDCGADGDVVDDCGGDGDVVDDCGGDGDVDDCGDDGDCDHDVSDVVDDDRVIIV